MSKPKPRIETDQLIKRLRLMGSAGGMLTKDRINAVLQAADRLEELDERVDIMMEQEKAQENPQGFNVFYGIPHPEVTKYES